MNKYTELSTIKDFLRFALSQFNQAELFYGHGTDNAWDEALALILHTLYLPHTLEPYMLDAKLTAPEKDLLQNLIEKRAKDRIPVPYLTKTAWFAELPFYVDERVLIPRSPIAELIEQGFEPWVDSSKVTSILDLCTGSGCIAIACAKAFPQAQIAASDISQDALDVAQINLEKHHVTDQVTLYKSDLFDQIPSEQFDIIVSNPPYVDAEDMANLPQEYRHEPELGLASGQDGLDACKRILDNASKYLSPNGILIVEVGNSEYALEELYPDLPSYWLEFDKSDGGVFLINAKDLNTWKNR